MLRGHSLTHPATAFARRRKAPAIDEVDLKALASEVANDRSIGEDQPAELHNRLFVAIVIANEQRRNAAGRARVKTDGVRIVGEALQRVAKLGTPAQDLLQRVRLESVEDDEDGVLRGGKAIDRVVRFAGCGHRLHRAGRDGRGRQLDEHESCRDQQRVLSQVRSQKIEARPDAQQNAGILQVLSCERRPRDRASVEGAVGRHVERALKPRRHGDVRNQPVARGRNHCGSEPRHAGEKRGEQERDGQQVRDELRQRESELVDVPEVRRGAAEQHERGRHEDRLGRDRGEAGRPLPARGDVTARCHSATIRRATRRAHEP